MHLTMRRPAVVAAAALTGLGVAVIPAGPALASPGCGAVLTTNTTVTSDLSCTGNAYTVSASGITVNLAGHTIKGSGTGTGITIGSGLPPGVHDVTITNGTVAGFAPQIDIESGHAFMLRKLQLTWPGEVGVTC